MDIVEEMAGTSARYDDSLCRRKRGCKAGVVLPQRDKKPLELVSVFFMQSNKNCRANIQSEVRSGVIQRIHGLNFSITSEPAMLAHG